MADQEIENETTATAVVDPPAEKPARKPRKRAERAAAAPAEEPGNGADAEPNGGAVAPVDAAPAEPVPVEVRGEVPSNGNGSEGSVSAAEDAGAPQKPQKRGSLPLLAADTVDIRMLKEMKLPDIAKVAKDV
ncbi:MAG: hypothetical protein ACXW19_07180, partial [Thermoanaerobaculia bacterium]